jgi:hypothetical protein
MIRDYMKPCCAVGLTAGSNEDIYEEKNNDR